MSVELPINEIKSAFLSAITQHELVVLSAPPGAGKSTGLPLWLLDNPTYNKIYLLQPRRMAAKSIACYLAQQLNEPVGQTIGYRLRNESKVSKHTKLEVITEGVLTQIIQQDPELNDCHLILFDEFHERSVHADFAFALAREVQTSLRDDLTLVLMSATLSIDFLRQALPDAHFLQSEGRSYPVDIRYQPVGSVSHLHARIKNSHHAWRDHALSVIQTQLHSHQGSILVFLPGSGDIHYIAERLRDHLPTHFVLSTLYGDLSLQEQQSAIMAPATGYKIVLATNIAETSLTIEGINLVIDSGLEKTAVYDPQTLTNKLNRHHITKASAQQRAGRAGRLMPGHCIRLYAKEAFERYPQHHVSEILQTDLQPLLIETARWGVTQLAQLPLLEQPTILDEEKAWSCLHTMNIVDGKHKLTPHGAIVSLLACHPRYAHMIILAHHVERDEQIKQLTYLACIIAAMLEEKDIFNPAERQHHADISARIRYLLAQQKVPLHQRIIKQAGQHYQQALHIVSENNETIWRTTGKGRVLDVDKFPLDYTGELIAMAYPERIAKMKNAEGSFLASNGKGLVIDHQDRLAQEPFIAAAVVRQYKSQLTVSMGAALSVERLIQWGVVHPSTEHIAEYQDKTDEIIAEQQIKLGAIVLESQRITQALTDAKIALMWQNVIEKKGLSLLAFTAEVDALLSRWRWINQYQQQLQFPNVSDEALIAQLPQWFLPFVGKVLKKSQLQSLGYGAMLLSLLDYQQQQLMNKIAPVTFIGPTGRHCPIRYNHQRSPTVSLPMQELYGQQLTPCVGEVNDIPLTLELLSPAGRPIQVTQDLNAFWQGSYKDVQKEMKGRYPKHYWPDDPANAQATNKTKRHLTL